ncbi:MAG: DinB family protein [Vicinamibacterales bacterium]
MKLTELLASEIDREGPLTRRALEVVPEGRDDWKPHEKSMPLGRLAALVAMMPSWVSMMIDTTELDLAPAPGTKSQFARELKTRKELVAEAEKGFAAARKALEGTTDEHLMQPWQLKMKGTVVQERPRYIMLRDALMHLSHHRGQLTVYLRMNGEKVPSIYGPSADDQRFE